MRQLPLLDVLQVGIRRAVFAVLLLVLHGEDDARVCHAVRPRSHGGGTIISIDRPINTMRFETTWQPMYTARIRK